MTSYTQTKTREIIRTCRNETATLQVAMATLDPDISPRQCAFIVAQERYRQLLNAAATAGPGHDRAQLEQARISFVLASCRYGINLPSIN